ncbi:phage major capsid protein [Siculibacillus lacustris]|uniref:Phage major capsid protein n=1 Tax=Siculibacillus lacustris TaxID=1549641 RepID=A0A4Q9VXH8_9HYPH|nr:phage major capsid protein [Siculibacillus lacustris]TBW40991.1 phage major capsid protein [Siculibacillus lacustris]
MTDTPISREALAACEFSGDAVAAPEIKSAEPSPGALDSAFEEFLRTFETYRADNDRRLAEIEKRGHADPLLDEKLARMDRALDEDRRRADRRALDAARPHLGRETRAASPLAPEHRAAFESYVRTGASQGLRPLEEKALSIGSGTDGGYLVPTELEREVTLRLAQISPIRAIAGNRQVSGAVFAKPFSATGPAVGWVGETAARPQTATPQLQQLSFPTMELYAMPSATAALLDDAAIDVESWIAEEVQQAFAEQEGAAFVNGDGSTQPKGFMAYDRVAAASWVWGKLGYLVTGAAGALPTSNPSDKLVDLVYAVKAGYRQNAAWVMNRKTQAEIRKLKDGQGNYLWQPPASAGAQATLMNFPVVEAEDMPAIAADACPIAFGDFRRGYLVVDRLGVRVLRDPFSAKPYVLFYTTKRVGGGVQDFDAIKLLKFGTA